MWIELTLKGGKKIAVNMNNIESFCAFPDGTRMVTPRYDGGEDFYTVAESYADIKAIVKPTSPEKPENSEETNE